MLSMILCNYIKLNVAISNFENNLEVDLTGNFNRIFLSCINSHNQAVNDILWKTIIEVGSASSKAWNELWHNKWKGEWRREFHNALKDNAKRPDIYNRINGTNIETTLSPGVFLKKSLSYRQERNVNFANSLSAIIKEDLNIHLLSSIQEKWDVASKLSDLLNETETESKNAVDKILLILSPYANRNQVERTNLLIQVQSIIDQQLVFINDNTTYYGRTFFFPLLSKWKRVVMKALEKKIADTMPQLVVLADPPYIVDLDGSKVVNLLIKNKGESTAEGCIMIPNVINLTTGASIKGKNVYKNEIPSGNNLEVPMKLPPAMNDVESIKLVMSISAIYQGKELPSTEFEFTLEKETIDTRGKYTKSIKHYRNGYCAKCPLRSKCTKSKNGRTLIINEKLIEYQEEVSTNLSTDEGIELMKQRSVQAEGIFGQIKQDKKYERLNRRGNPGVKLELLLVSMGHNLRRYHTRKKLDQNRYVS